MSSILKPRGRDSLQKELLRFGRHLVYAEGTKTEPNYIESIKKEIANKYLCNLNDIEIFNAGNGRSYSTVSLVKFVQDDVKKRLSEGERINHVWIFYDKDDFEVEDFKEANSMINRMNNSKEINDEGFKFNIKTNITWHSCYSNEAFELWYCLYFDNYNRPLTRKDYKKILDEYLKHVGKYSKKRKDMHQVLIENGGNLENAMEYAKRLSKNGMNNPSTNAYLFLEYFKPYMK